MKRVLLVGAAALVFAGAMTGGAFARGPGGGGGGGHAAFGGGGGGRAAVGGGGFAAPRASVGTAPRASVGGNFARGGTVNRGFARGGVAQGNWGGGGWNGRRFDHRHFRGFGVVPFALGGVYAYDYPDYDYYSGDPCIQWNGWAWVNVCY